VISQKVVGGFLCSLGRVAYGIEGAILWAKKEQSLVSCSTGNFFKKARKSTSGQRKKLHQSPIRIKGATG